MSVVDVTSFGTVPDREMLMLDGGAGEMSHHKPRPSGASHIIVSEIMNDIFNNAFELILSKSFDRAPESKINPTVVGDIIENILSESPRKSDETILLDEEIKKIIKEMKAPPEEPRAISTQGIGDQLKNNLEEPCQEARKRTTLERKNRLTNLVKNSKQMLTKLVANDDSNMASNSEEVQEELLKVINLESESGDDLAEDKPEAFSEAQLKSSSLKKEILRRCTLRRKENLPRKKISFGARILKYFRRNRE